MTILLPALSVAFAAFCINWAVKIVNRDEDWIHAARICVSIAISVIIAIAATMLGAIFLYYVLRG